ncbi:MAG: Nif3-like dinuclear metal center hexameric protein [Acetatifactor sp.]|nr:Nif3-like dinuclear metal center hexameric protein [Acetatifactor sp.]
MVEQWTDDNIAALKKTYGEGGLTAKRLGAKLLMDEQDVEDKRMKISELFQELLKWGSSFDSGAGENRTCDTCKAGDMDEEIRGIGVSMFATPEVIRACAQMNANLLIVHEPTYYEHWDDTNLSIIGREKQRLIEESGLTVVRFHDHAHAMNPDLIYAGEMRALGLQGTLQKQEQFAINRFELKEGMTARELAHLIESKLGIKHVRIAGCADKPGRRISCSFGTPGHLAEELEENDFVLTGEICEWADGQRARDYAQMGYNKAILVMGHIGSEREGMRYLAEILQGKYPSLHTKYIECGEVYQYTDDR